MSSAAPRYPREGGKPDEEVADMALGRHGPRRAVAPRSQIARDRKFRRPSPPAPIVSFPLSGLLRGRGGILAAAMRFSRKPRRVSRTPPELLGGAKRGLAQLPGYLFVNPLSIATRSRPESLNPFFRTRYATTKRRLRSTKSHRAAK